MVNMQLVTSDSKLRVRIEAETLGPLIVAWIRPAWMRCSNYHVGAGSLVVGGELQLIGYYCLRLDRVANMIHSREIVEYSNELNIRLKIKETQRDR